MKFKKKKRPRLAMFSKITMAMALVIIFLFLPIFSQAAIRDTVTYQAKVTDVNLLAPVDGDYNMEFKIYDAASAGNLLWTETWNGGNQVAMEDGVFTVELNSICASWTGACASNGGIDWSSDSLFLEVSWDADNNGSFEELFSPRKRFTSSPYAQMAARLDTADDINFTDNTNHSLQWDETSDRTLTIENDDATAVANLSVEGQMQTGNFSSAPTAVGNGALYYNTTDNKLYMQENGSWVAVGSGSASGDSIWDADSDTGIQVEEGADDDTIRFDLGDASGTAYADILTIDGSNGLVWNDAGNDLDFRLEGDTNANLFFIDAGTDQIALGNNSPNAFLDISSDIADALRLNPYGINAGNTANLEFMELAANGSNYVGFKAPDNIATDTAWVLPNVDGGSGEVLSTDGSGTLSWVSPGGTADSIWDADSDTGIQVEEGADDDTIRFDLGGATPIGDALLMNQTNGLVWNDAGNALDFRLEGDIDPNLFFADASADNIGIGAGAPDANAKLEVAGNLMLDDYVYFNNTTTDYLRHDGTTFVMSDDFLPSTDDTYDLGTSTTRWNDQFMGGTLYMGADGDDYDIHFDEANNTLRFNDGGEANDIVIEGDTSPYLLHIDGANNQVGVNLPVTQPLFDTSLVVFNELDDAVVRLGGPDGDYHHGARLRFGDGNYVYMDEYADDNFMMYAAGNLVLDSGYGEVYMPDAYSNSITGRDLYVASNGEIGYVASSIRFKENVLDMENIDWLYDLRPVNFNYKDQTKEVYNKETGEMETVEVEVDKSKQYGLIAEEVEEVNSAIISYDSDGLPETVNYSHLITPLLKAVQENKAAVDPLLERIKVVDNGLEINKGENSPEEQDVLVLHNEGNGAGIHVVQNGDSNNLGHGAAIYISGSKDSQAGDNNGIDNKSDRYGLYINSEEKDAAQKLFGIESDAGKKKDEETFYVRADGVTKVYADNKAPKRTEDGEFGFSEIGGWFNQGRLYFQAGGKDYYINNSGTGDFSEYIASADVTLHKDWGTIVSVDTSFDQAKVKRSSEIKDKNVLGVVSQHGTRNNDNDTGTRHENPEYVNVALMGQVPAKVTIQNGIIEAGDYLTTSLVYGHAMKADVGDPVIGIALETFTGNANSNEGMIDMLLSRNTNGNISALLAELQENKSLSKEEVLEVIMNENLVANYLVMTKGEVMAGLKVHGELALDKQNIGEVVIPAGETSLLVNFPTHFSKKPVVTATPHLVEDNDIFFNFQYLLVNIETSSFTIKLNQPLAYDLHFNWQAFAVADYTNDFTVAEEPSQVSQTVDDSSTLNSVNCSLDNLSACVTAHDCWQFSDQAMWDGNACVLKESDF